MHGPEPSQPVHGDLPGGPLSIERIDSTFTGQWVLVRVTAADELETPLEGEVVATGKRPIGKMLGRIAEVGEDPAQPYCLFRAGEPGESAMHFGFPPPR
jgi:hypothetical protein